MKAFAVLLASLSVAAGAAAQTLPSEPVSLANGRVVLGGDVSASIAPEDLGFFNYSDYDHSALRELRLGMTALVRATDRVSVLADIRSENLERVAPFALYARIHPFPGKRLDVNIGRVPPTFGSFSRLAYSKDNVLIGYPLAYQYLTSLRADALPASNDELLRMRGRGWLSSFSVGDTTPARGLPLVTAFNWDTGVQVTTGWKVLTVTGSVTNGTPSNPRVTDDNGGKQIATRVAVTPATGLIVGSSYARGEFPSRHVLNQLSADPDETYSQRAYGVDAEYSRGHWLMRGEAVLSEWRIPIMTAGNSALALRAADAWLEGRYTFLPGAYVAARGEHVTFNKITGSVQTLPWDAPVTRVEVGVGYYLQRNLILKFAVQSNKRDAGRVHEATLPAAQLLFWF